MVQKIFITALMLLCILTGCSKDRAHNQSYAIMTIDGKEYRSVVMYSDSYSISGRNEVFKNNGNYFKLRYEHTMTAGNSASVDLLIRVIDKEHYQLKQRYPIPDDPSSLNDYSTASIIITENGRKIYYYATEGWMELDDVREISENEDGEIKLRHFQIDGHFAFKARDEHSGKVIKVTDGTFHNTMFVSSEGVYMTMK